MSDMQRSAELSSDGRYRYVLDRVWGDGDIATFVMLNPSTADENVDDSTIRKCIGFARSWGFSGLKVINLYAYRSTDPSVLKEVDDPVGPDNDAWIARVAAESKLIVAAWGNHADAARVEEFIRALPEGMPVHSLKITAQGMPSHPLYLSADLEPLFWRVGGSGEADLGWDDLDQSEAVSLPADPLPELKEGDAVFRRNRPGVGDPLDFYDRWWRMTETEIDELRPYLRGHAEEKNTSIVLAVYEHVCRNFDNVYKTFAETVDDWGEDHGVDTDRLVRDYYPGVKGLFLYSEKLLNLHGGITTIIPSPTPGRWTVAEQRGSVPWELTDDRQIATMLHVLSEALTSFIDESTIPDPRERLNTLVGRFDDQVSSLLESLERKTWDYVQRFFSDPGHFFYYVDRIEDPARDEDGF